jgi:hypothetical protein
LTLCEESGLYKPFVLEGFVIFPRWLVRCNTVRPEDEK